MKILKVNLIAFGPFTETVLNLGDGEEGFHIVYGLNEAGKSSALRALRQMLYGVPERSQDNFIHSYGSMRIGGVIKHGDGSVLEFIRRKGRGNTLRAADDTTPLDEAILHRFLTGVDHDLFATMFGIDHADLIRGGQEIIRGGGSLGQILFAAGAGLSELRRVEIELQTAVDDLFKPSGQKPRINKAIADLKASQRKLRDSQLPGQEWLRHDQALRQALERRLAVERVLGLNQTERHRLERIREALPTIGRRKACLEELASYAGVVLLPDDFGERRRALINSRSLAENDRKQAQANIEEGRKAIAELKVPEAVLEQADIIDELYRELGSYLKAAKDRAQLLTRRDVLRSEAQGILSSLRKGLTLDEAEKLRLTKTEAVRIQELGTQYERLVTRLEGERDNTTRISLHIEALDKELGGLETPRPLNELRGALEQAREYSALEDRCRTEHDAVCRARASLETALRRQVLWPGKLEELEILPLPSAETIDSFDQRFRDERETLARLQAEIEGLEGEILELEAGIEELRLEREVPTEEDLLVARNKREQGWRLVRRVWEGHQQPDSEAQEFVQFFQPANTLAEAFEQSVERTDELADRLRREADRVARKAKFLAERQVKGTKVMLAQAELKKAEYRFANIDQEWSKLWESVRISPRSPREMRVWCQDQRALLERAGEVQERRAMADELKKEIDARRTRVGQCLQAISGRPTDKDESLSDLIRRGDKIIRLNDDIRTKRERLLNEKKERQRELHEAGLRLTTLEQQLSGWQKEWGERIRPLGLAGGTLPAQASVLLDELKRLFDLVKEADILHKRVQGIDREAEEFSSKTKSLTKRISSDLVERPVDQAAAELQARLNGARTARSRLETLETRQRQDEQLLQDAMARIAEIDVNLAAMCKEAACSDLETLRTIEERSAKRRELESELKRIDQVLLKLSGGATVEAFVQEAQMVDPDGIDTQIERLTAAIEQLGKERSDLDQTIGSERTELTKMNGGARAADVAEHIQSTLGRLATDVEHYTRLRLAMGILDQAIERYREKHQGPVLARASQLFSRMTSESFEGLRVEIDEQTRPTLVGVRRGNKTVAVEGMSDGTVDQLYLALRLASLEEYVETNEPLPFIVDDILIRFDNQRAAATLKALGQLSKNTQVIFFTHHHHLLDLAKEVIDPATLFVHVLTI